MVRRYESTQKNTIASGIILLIESLDGDVRGDSSRCTASLAVLLLISSARQGAKPPCPSSRSGALLFATPASHTERHSPHQVWAKLDSDSWLLPLRFLANTMTVRWGRGAFCVGFAPLRGDTRRAVMQVGPTARGHGPRSCALEDRMREGGGGAEARSWALLAHVECH